MRRFGRIHKKIFGRSTRITAAAPWPASLATLVFNLSVVTLAYHLFVLASEFPHIGRDFMNIWAAARLILTGKIAALFDPVHLHAAQQSLFSQSFLQYYLSDIPGLQIQYNWAYPPHILPWIAGFGWLSYPWALLLWTAGTFAFYAFAVAYKRPQAWWVAFALAACPASGQNIDFGYTGFLIAAFMVGGVRLLDTKPLLAGVLFAFLTFKPQFAVLVPLALLAGRYWQALAAMILTTGILVCLGILLYGLEPWRSYFHAVIPYQTSILELIPTDTKKIRMIYMVTPFMAARLLGLSLSMSYVVTALFVSAAAAAVVSVFRRSTPPELRNAVLLTAVYLATPYAFVSDMTLLSAAVVCMMVANGSRPLSILEWILLVIIWLLPDLAGLLNTFKLPVIPLFIAGLLVLQLQWAIRAGNDRYSIYKGKFEPVIDLGPD